jgi:hypothetical protein
MADALQNGRYVVVGLLGEGSQGQTLDAVDKREGRPVAIKRFDVRGARGWKDVELAEREIRVLQSLAHPMLPRYFDHFEEGGALYLVMERIEGESLFALRKRGALFSADEALRFLGDAAVALDYLHERAPPVIHRDLKPGNALRRADGSHAFVDFGAVRDKLRPEGGSTVVGTFGYMAPEQFQGRAQPSSDVYAIGATTLSMLTGREPETLPHKGLAIDVRRALASGGQRIAGPLAAILERMLDPDPDRRPARIAPLLAGVRPSETGAGRDPWRAGVDAWHRAMREENPSLSRRAARRAVRRARRAARRALHGRVRQGPPAWLMVVFFGVAIVAVSLATQVVVPAVLFALSRILRKPELVRAADEVRRAGIAGMANLRDSQAWFEGRTQGTGERAPGDGDTVRVAVEGAAEPSQPRTRIDDNVDDNEGDDDPHAEPGRTSKIR